jgi:hypothetical protein
LGLQFGGLFRISLCQRSDLLWCRGSAYSQTHANIVQIKPTYRPCLAFSHFEQSSPTNLVCTVPGPTGQKLMPLHLTRELVLKKVRDCFPDSKGAAHALAIVEAYGNESWHLEAERVQLAALMQCRGNLERLRQLIELAAIDYRDVLAGAEYRDESQAPCDTPQGMLVAIRQRDRDRYERWLSSEGGRQAE